jgi:hypothetical protein
MVDYARIMPLSLIAGGNLELFDKVIAASLRGHLYGVRTSVLTSFTR